MSFDGRLPDPDALPVLPSLTEARISDILAVLRTVPPRPDDAGAVRLRDFVAALGEHSFAALVLVFALLLVSPLSAIPGATTAFGLAIAAVVAQMVLGRAHVWLPGVLLDRRLPVTRLRAALVWLERPARALERGLKPRLALVVAPPLGRAPKLLVLAAALCAPLMEVIPGSGTSIGAAITLFAAGLLARDGVFVLLGAGLAAILPTGLWLLLN